MGSRFRDAAPRRSGDEAGNTHHRGMMACAGHDSRGLDEPQAQGVKLRNAPHRAFWHGHAQAPHEPRSSGVQEQPQLVRCRLRTRRAIHRQMRLPGFDVGFGFAAPAVDILIKHAGISRHQIGDHEAHTGAFRLSDAIIAPHCLMDKLYKFLLDLTDGLNLPVQFMRCDKR